MNNSNMIMTAHIQIPFWTPDLFLQKKYYFWKHIILCDDIILTPNVNILSFRTADNLIIFSHIII